jgi:hypothetical protein
MYDGCKGATIKDKSVDQKEPFRNFGVILYHISN